MKGKPQRSNGAASGSGDEIVHRGPDSTSYIGLDGDTCLVFHRLAINDVSANGDQPMNVNGTLLMCNGEIYNWKELMKKYKLELKSGSDCEIIAHLFNMGLSMKEILTQLDGVFAFVILAADGKVYAARDPLGVRPLFWCKTDNCLAFCSEAKGLMSHFVESEIKAFDKESYYSDDEQCVKQYEAIVYPSDVPEYPFDPEEIANLLTAAVRKRLMSDRKVACLLSGGLDSSLIAALASRLSGRLHTFSIGIDRYAPDLVNARRVAEHIGSIHKEIIYTTDEAIKVLPDVIYSLESYDCTTVRASVPMYLLLKYIADNTDFKVILSGEGADELFGGYLYLHNAPDRHQFQKETHNLLKNVQHFDVTRADRCAAAHGLEIRVPFFDKALVNFILKTNPSHKTSSKTRIEKWILREAFAGRRMIPDTVLWRRKDAFSDAVGRSWVEFLKEHAEENVKEMDPQIVNKGHVSMTKEEYMYKVIYRKYYMDLELLPYIWRPKWTEVLDPSATLLGIPF